MKLIVASELETRTYAELSAIYSGVSKFLVQSKPHTMERANAIGSLENVSRAMALRFR